MTNGLHITVVQSIMKKVCIHISTLVHNKHDNRFLFCILISEGTDA